MSAYHRQTLRGSAWLILILGVVTAFDAMAIDMYLPAFTAIGDTLGLDQGGMHATLSMFLLGLAVGQLAYGPLSDRFGPRAPLVGGIAVFALASAILAMTQSQGVFFAARLLQGLGAAAGIAIPRIIVADLYDTRTAAKVFSLLMQVMMVAPVVAPPLGGMLLEVLGWRSIFWGFVCMSAAAIAAIFGCVPGGHTGKTLHGEDGRGSVLRRYGHLLSDRRFASYTLSSAFCLAGLFVYIGSSAFIYVEYFGLSPTVYSWVFAANAAAMILAGQLNIALLGRWTETQILLASSLCQAALILGLLGYVLGGGSDLYVVGGLVMLITAAISLILGNLTAVSMAHANGETGSASSLLGVVQYSFAGLTGVALGLVHDGTLMPQSLALLICSVGTLALFAIAERSPAAAMKET